MGYYATRDKYEKWYIQCNVRWKRDGNIQCLDENEENEETFDEQTTLRPSDLGLSQELHLYVLYARMILSP